MPVTGSCQISPGLGIPSNALEEKKDPATVMMRNEKRIGL
jgi:hypothetical protein